MPDRVLSRPQRSSLEAYLARLKAPVDFARRADGAKLAVIRNLGAFLSGSAQEGLNNADYRAIHPQLERLRRLLDGYDESPLERRQAQLSTIGALLDDLRTGVFPLAPLARKTKTAPREIADGRFDLDSPIQALAGVGPRKADLLRRLGVERVGDLLWMIPWRYYDRGSLTSFGGLSAGQDATVCGKLHTVEEVVTSRRRFRMINGVLGDKTGTLGLRWFNQGYLRNRLSPGQILMCTGRIKPDGLFQRWRMDNPQFEILNEDESPSLHMGRIVPVYHETRGMNSRVLRVLIDRVLAHAHGFEVDCLPAEIVERCGLLARREAFTAVHFPPPDADLDSYHAARSAAHRRLVFEELFLLELGLAVRRHQTLKTREGIAFRCVPARLEAFWAALPFTPTTAQRRVVDEVLTDMAAARPMNRLIQGDVGCGKTVVAAAAIWMAIADGYQAALMAPTELLADQHHRQIVSLLGSLGVRVGALTGDRSPRDRAENLARLARGETDCIVGTHALVQPDVRFARFGFAVIDEQHKFGVLQRSHLKGKGCDPDVLIMTATPIPRTLALTVYGDLDVSIVDEMPKGRWPIETRWYTERQRAAANDAIQRAIQQGHQAYVVAPLIEESDG
ncbi:MAG: DEAD/DEAH box helicase, partial [Nitrospiria bacterium]